MVVSCLAAVPLWPASSPCFVSAIGRLYGHVVVSFCSEAGNADLEGRIGIEFGCVPVYIEDWKLKPSISEMGDILIVKQRVLTR